MSVESIIYYPVKGLGGTALAQTEVGSRGLAYDRRFGLEFNDHQELLGNPNSWRPWNYFLNLKKEKWASLVNIFASVEEEAGDAVLTLSTKDNECISANTADARQRRRLEQFIGDFLQMPPPKLVDGGSTSFWDTKDMPVSLVNSASVAALSQESGASLQDARFRANIVFSAPAWQEENWQGRLTIGDVSLRAVEGIPRCAAANVNTSTAEMDCSVASLLQKSRGHNALGIYATVERGGEISTGLEIYFESST